MAGGMKRGEGKKVGRGEARRRARKQRSGKAKKPERRK
jgi:hypothetical protein